MRDYTSPAVVDVAPTAYLTDTVFGRAAKDPGAVMLRRPAPAAAGAAAAPGSAGTSWMDVSAGDFAREVRALARGLISAGIAPGDRIGLLSRNRYEWTLADYAVWAAGGVTVPVYETSSPDQVEWVLADSGARALIIEKPAHARALATVTARLPALTHVWVMDAEAPDDGAPVADDGGAVADDGEGAAASDGSAPPAPRPLAEPLAAGASGGDEEIDRRRRERGAADIASIIYTSGTTGRPKGCVLTHANLLAEVRSASSGPLEPAFSQDGMSTLLFLPLAHVLARVMQIGCLDSGVVLGHVPDTTRLREDLASYQPSFLLAVPRVFEKVYNSAELLADESPVKARLFRAAARTAIAWSEAQDPAGGTAGPGLALRWRHAVFDHLVYAKLRAALGGRVTHVLSGGAPLGERLGHFFRGIGTSVLEGYGLTETTAAATVNPIGHVKIGTVGPPLPGMSVRIGDDGEVLVRGPVTFTGYWRNDPATAEALADGWLRTGDLGELDEDGYLRITGRKKELIVTAGGKNVAPAPMEDRVRAHHLVSQCVVVGDGRPYIACLITLDADALPAWRARHGGTAEPGEDPRLLAELQHCVDNANEAVSRAESIRRFRVLPGDFTEANGYLTPSLKVRRARVLADFAADIDALYGGPPPPAASTGTARA